MKKRVLMMFPLLVALNVSADEDKVSPADAKALHEKHCTSCHLSMHGDSDSFYNRIDRKITTYEKLSAQVNRCKNNIGLQWFDEETQAVIDYLNDTYYKIKK